LTSNLHSMMRENSLGPFLPMVNKMSRDWPKTKDVNDGNQVNGLLADINDELLAVDNGSEVNRPMSANGKGHVEEHLIVKRKMVAP